MLFMVVNPVSRTSLMNVVKTLPTAPQILAQLGDLLLDINTGLEEITNLLRRDVGLTVRLMRVANSPVYAKGTPSGSLVEALSRVGFKEVYRLTGFAAVAQLSDQKLQVYSTSGTQLRENSLLTALFMEALAEQAGVDVRMAYTAGLLRSTGKIALDRILRDDPANPVVDAGVADLLLWEIDTAGMDNGVASSFILDEWHFPPELTQAIKLHSKPGSDAGTLAHLLNVAAGEAERAGHGLCAESGYWELTPERISAANLTAEQIANARGRALAAFDAVRQAVS